jgi:hypothetical protein
MPRELPCDCGSSFEDPPVGAINQLGHTGEESRCLLEVALAEL